MATIKFIVRSKSETASIYVRFKEGRLIDLTAKTKFIINSDNWSETKGKPNNLKDASLKSLWADLVNFQAALLDYYNACHNKLEINKQWLRDFIYPTQKTIEVTNMLVSYYDFYISLKKGKISLSTEKKLKVQKHLIERFQIETKTEYLIKDVNPTFVKEFEKYCIKQKYSKNTISQVVKSIKTICFHAQTNDIEISNKLNNIKLAWETSDKIYLNLEELKLIDKLKLQEGHLLAARDWLLISCETGQRVSDFLNFKKEMIREEGGKSLIEFTQTKTGKIMTVPLSKRVLAILKKRKGEFPIKMSDQRYNEHIKTVCMLAGLTNKIKGSLIEVSDKKNKVKRKKSGIFEKWELVSSHIGRRSFATNNYGKIPTSLLIGATGHSTEKLFLEYIGKTDTQKAMQLAEYF